MAKKWWTLAAVVTGVFMLLLDLTIVNAALPSIQRAFHGSLASLQWVIDAYTLVLAAFLLVGGSLSDRYGRRRLFAIGIVIFTAGSLLCGLATGSLFLSLSRAVQGIGGAIMYATSLALLGNAFRGKDRGTAFGVYGAVSGIAVAVGPLAGGLITTEISWRWVFLVNIPIGIAAAAITLAKVDESRDPAAVRVDVAGFVTFAGGLAALVYGLIESADGWTQARVLVSLGLAAVLLILFGVAEVSQRRPMLDLTLLRKPTFDGGLFSAFALSGSMFAMIMFIVLYLQDLLGYSPLDAGLRTTSITLSVLVAATVAGRLTTVVPVRLMIGAGFALIGGGLLLMRGLTATSAWTHLVPGMIAGGVGAGLVTVPLSSTAVGVVEPARGGMASGINSTFRQVGLATGIALYGSLFASQLQHGVTAALAGTPYAAQAGPIGVGARAGLPAGHIPPVVADAIRAGFTSGLNRILLIAACLALAAAVSSLLLIRARDFIPAGPPPSGTPAPAETPAPAAAPEQARTLH